MYVLINGLEMQIHIRSIFFTHDTMWCGSPYYIILHLNRHSYNSSISRVLGFILGRHQDGHSKTNMLSHSPRICLMDGAFSFVL